MDKLDPVARKSHIEVYVQHTDDMPFGSACGRPHVFVHVVDLCTGRPLQPRQRTSAASFCADKVNAFQWNVSHTWGIPLHEFVSARMLVLFEIAEPRRKLPTQAASKLLKDGRRFVNLHRAQAGQNNTDHGQHDDDHDNGDLSSSRFKRLGWCFFRPVSHHGSIRMPSLSVTEDDYATSTLRLQLFAYQSLHWIDQHQARAQWHLGQSTGVSAQERVPAVFLQYQKRTQVRLPSSLFVDVRPVATAAAVKSRRLSGIAEQDSAEQSIEEPLGDNQEAPNMTIGLVDEGNNQEEQQHIAAGDKNLSGKSDETKAEAPDPLLQCRRSETEPCLIPHRVLHRLPTGRMGCACVAFSPDGTFLAAGVHQVTATATEWVVSVYDVSSGALWQCGRGHQGMIYSLHWKDETASVATPALVSASSDGCACLWLVRATKAPAVHAVEPHIQWQHVPAPTYVYSALFHPSQAHFVVTGASDGLVRFWHARSKELDADAGVGKDGRLSTPALQWRVSDAAVHCVCVERKTGRVLCGDGGGNITVWTPIAEAPSGSDSATSSAPLPRYELLKTVRTGQASVASMQLHPRKSHLLVLTQPHRLLQLELRAFLVLHKAYAGVACATLLVQARFSADGRFVVAGSEDGAPALFASLHGQRLGDGGVWGARFFHGGAALGVAWSPRAHVAALSAYGAPHPIVLLCAHRGDPAAPDPDADRPEMGAPIRHPGQVQSRDGLTPPPLPMSTLPVGKLKMMQPSGFAAASEASGMDRTTLDSTTSLTAERVQRALQRRHQRLQAKLALEVEAARLAVPEDAHGVNAPMMLEK